MRYRLDATIAHKDWSEPMKKVFFYLGDTKSDIVAQIDTLDCHKHNLNKHGRTAFKDDNGVKHTWKLTLIPELN